jgi:hypothetical protein
VRPVHSYTITGTSRRDVLRGTAGDDVVCGLGGDDVILGLGDDVSTLVPSAAPAGLAQPRARPLPAPARPRAVLGRQMDGGCQSVDCPRCSVLPELPFVDFGDVLLQDRPDGVHWKAALLVDHANGRAFA